MHFFCPRIASRKKVGMALRAILTTTERRTTIVTYQRKRKYWPSAIQRRSSYATLPAQCRPQESRYGSPSHTDDNGVSDYYRHVPAQKKRLALGDATLKASHTAAGSPSPVIDWLGRSRRISLLPDRNRASLGPGRQCRQGEPARSYDEQSAAVH